MQLYASTDVAIGSTEVHTKMITALWKSDRIADVTNDITFGR